LKKQNKQPEFSITLEPSTDIHLPSTRVEPTTSLSTDKINNKKTRQRTTEIEIITRSSNHESSQNLAKSNTKTNLKIKESASKMMEIIGTVVHEFIQNSTNEKVDVKPEEV
jgi:3'-phosphoadenosine 5'-phosphosulfate (PAPS) 3'-phosphatase